MKRPDVHGCPRCDRSVSSRMKRCPQCGLVFTIMRIRRGGKVIEKLVACHPEDVELIESIVPEEAEGEE